MVRERGERTLGEPRTAPPAFADAPMVGPTCTAIARPEAERYRSVMVGDDLESVTAWAIILDVFDLEQSLRHTLICNHAGSISHRCGTA